MLVDRGLRLDVPPPPAAACRPAGLLPTRPCSSGPWPRLDRVVEAETSVLAGARRRRALRPATAHGQPGPAARAPRPADERRRPDHRHRCRRRAAPSTTRRGTPAPRRAAPRRRAHPCARAALAAVLDSLGPGDWAALTTAAASTRELLAAAWSQRLAAAVLLGRDVATAVAQQRQARDRRAHPAARLRLRGGRRPERRRAAPGRRADAAPRCVRLEVAVSGSSSTTPAGLGPALPGDHPGRRPAARGPDRSRSAVDAGTELAGPGPMRHPRGRRALERATLQALAVDWRVPLTAFPGRTMSYDPMYDLVPAHFAHASAATSPTATSRATTGSTPCRACIRDLLAEWELEPIGRSSSGVCAVAIPVRLPARPRPVGVSGEGVLKVDLAAPGGRHEHLALQTWDGHGAVRLVRADPSRFADAARAARRPRPAAASTSTRRARVIGDLLGTAATGRPIPAAAQPQRHTPPGRRRSCARLRRCCRGATSTRRPRSPASWSSGRRRRGPAAAHRPALRERARRRTARRGSPSTPSRWPATRPSRWPRPCGTARTSSAPARRCGGRCAGGSRSSASAPASTRAGPGRGRSSARRDNALEAAEAADGPADDAWAHDRISLAVTIIKAMND